MGPWRKLFKKDRSLYLNLPKHVIDDAGLSSGDSVHVRYVEGIGIIVSFPIKLTLGVNGGGKEYRLAMSKRGKTALLIEPDSFPVIPLFDGVSMFRQK